MKIGAALAQTRAVCGGSRDGTRVALFPAKRKEEVEGRAMDLYTRNVLVGAFAILVMSAVLVGEVVTWASCDIETAKEVVQKVSLGVSTSGTLFLAFIYVRGSKRQKGKNASKSSFFSHEYHGPKLKPKE